MPVFEATPEQRRTVRAMAGFGVPQDEIATSLDIDPQTLRKHFRAALDRGSTEATTKVVQSLFRMATEGNNVGAAIFWMKARAGWSERQRIEHGFGNPLAVVAEGHVPMTSPTTSWHASPDRGSRKPPRPLVATRRSAGPPT